MTNKEIRELSTEEIVSKIEDTFPTSNWIFRETS